MESKIIWQLFHNGNSAIGISEIVKSNIVNSSIGNSNIGHRKIGNKKIGNIKIGNSKIGNSKIGNINNNIGIVIWILVIVNLALITLVSVNFGIS